MAIDHEQGQTPEVIIGGTYDHFEGTSYRVDAVVTRAEDYERTHQLSEDVIYTQLNDGEVNPAGTQYTRSKTQFLFGTVEVEGNEVPIFTLRA